MIILTSKNSQDWLVWEELIIKSTHALFFIFFYSIMYQ